MSGLKRNTINDIINSLRDQYHNGFPVIKELIQNADDSGAKHFMFGLHQGFGKEIQHPLFQDTGLWCLNDGSFKSEDKEAIRSFGINTKAGDSSTIGKFGLGMKSVFHLCESFCYIAFDGQKIHSDIINPWNNDEPEHLHSDWESLWETHSENIIEHLKQLQDNLGHNSQTWSLHVRLVVTPKF